MTSIEMPQLDSAEVHVWPVRLDVAWADTEAFAAVLSDDEAKRASGFHFERDRRSFQVCRGALRMLLGAYLKQAANSIQFAYGPRGKPQIGDGNSVSFNVSHSANLALFAVGRGLELGVDVEAIRPIPELDSIARRFFSAQERAALMSTSESERQSAFFRCWTRKEAYIKAIGEGLSAPLDRFSVTMGTDEAAHYIHIGYDQQEASNWTLQDIKLEWPYVGAVSYRAQPKHLLLKPIMMPAEFRSECSQV